MGLKDTIRSAVNTGFKALGDLAEVVTYSQPGSTVAYDVASGEVDTGVPTEVSIDGSLWEPADTNQDPGLAELRKQAVSGDQFCHIPGLKLSSVVPTTRDQITRAGQVWYIKGFKHDPAQGLWSLLMTQQVQPSA